MGTKALLFAINERLIRLESKTDDLSKRMDKVETRIEKLSERINSVEEKLSERITRLEKKPGEVLLKYMGVVATMLLSAALTYIAAKVGGN